MLHSFAAVSGSLAPLQPDLARVHALLWRLGEADGALLQDLVRTLLDRPGDMYRAAAALALARAARPEVPDTIIQFAAAVQMVYAASQAHRTIEATVTPTMDERLVVLTGDYLYAQAAAITANLKNLQVMAQLAESIKAICREGAYLPAVRVASFRSDGLYRLSLWGAAELLRLPPDLQASLELVGHALDAAADAQTPPGAGLHAALSHLEATPSFATLAGAESLRASLLALAPGDALPGKRRSP